MKKTNKERRKLETMRPGKALATARKLLDEKPTLKRFDKVRRLSHWRAPEPTLSHVKEHMDQLTRQEFVKAYQPAKSDSAVAAEIKEMVLYDPALAEEFVLNQLERLDQAGIHKHLIAEIMGVSITTVYNWRKMIAKRRQEQYDRLPESAVPDFAGDVLHFYLTIKQLGFQMIHKEGASDHAKTEGIRIAMRAQRKIVEYQTLLGYYDDKSKLLQRCPEYTPAC